MRGRDHARAGEFGAERQGVGVQTHQFGDEQEQPPDPCRELARREREAADVGDCLGAGPGYGRTLLVEPPRQRCEPFRGEDLAYRSRTEWHSPFGKRLTDLVD